MTTNLLYNKDENTICILENSLPLIYHVSWIPSSSLQAVAWTLDLKNSSSDLKNCMSHFYFNQ